VADETTAADTDVEAPEVDEVNERLLSVLTDSLGEALVASHISRGTLWVRVTREAWATAAEAGRDRLGLTFFDFLSAIDWKPSPWGRYEDAVLDTGLKHPDADAAEYAVGYTGGDTRFQVFSRLVDVRRHRAVIFKADVPDDDLTVPSLVPLFGGANWHERECWEMFGISFDGHPALRHLYLPGGFEGHPLRKDFPLLARLVKPWPGIVDVEPMPAEADPAADSDAAAGDGATGDTAAESGGDS
jgi:NADH-quinone oxidoreductase subunit C